MFFATPPITRKLAARLRELDELRKGLNEGVATFSPWLGTLRREAKAISVESSISIEGFAVSHDEALAAVEGEESTSTEEGRFAASCYARAMDHVGVMATDPAFAWLDRVILDLHFDACHFQPDKSPGHWRSGPIAVTGAGAPEGIAYRGPDAEDVPPLMAEVVEWLESGDLDTHSAVRAAMAHLHVVSVHPFRDGNGRIARIVQSLVLAREGLVSAEFGSIEEYLARHTADYYAVLGEVQGGSYQPKRDASPWIDFCVDAHLAQARQRLEQMDAAARRWAALEELAGERAWPERLVIALEQSLMGGSSRMAYSREADVSPATASADFRRLLDAGLVDLRGQGPSTAYVASERLRRLVR